MRFASPGSNNFKRRKNAATDSTRGGAARRQSK
jgi:hypothetical protein